MAIATPSRTAAFAHRSRQRLGTRLALTAVMLLTTGLAQPSRPAAAAFPGTNGKIVFAKQVARDGLHFAARLRRKPLPVWAWLASRSRLAEK